ncbi:MAG: response regulator transcription factor [Nitrospirae bacterium]|nr:response regulator transcription factor [Nitrospirota bacterium]
MKIKVPENSPVRVDFREPRLEQLSDMLKVLFISESDMDIEVPKAEAYFRVGMTIEGTVVSFPGVGTSGIKCFVKAVSSNRCNLVIEKAEPRKPLLDYLQQRESLDKLNQQTYKPAVDVGGVMFNKFMEEQKQPKELPRKKVLIVDDAISVHDRFRTAFVDNGFEVLQAVDGMEGIKLALEAHPDIILMDVNMPKMSGVEATRIIKSNPRTSSIPICMFTTEGEQDFIMQAIKIGVKDYIIKTSDAALVIQRIRKIIGDG